jgi:peptidyl-tRNA hydrolase, PTH1 family
MKIIIGLGNIGKQYEKTRHNAGFITIDEIANTFSDVESKIKWKENSDFKSLIFQFIYKNQTILLVKPTTLMNQSGQAVRKIMDFYKELPKNILIIFDDIDLPIGEIRYREKGSAGTHNGMKSIISCLNTENFPRIKIGIESRGDLSPKNQELSSFVLSTFNEKEWEIIQTSIEKAKNIIEKEFLSKKA